jgi:phage pi2 protein 07
MNQAEEVKVEEQGQTVPEVQVDTKPVFKTSAQRMAERYANMKTEAPVPEVAPVVSETDTTTPPETKYDYALFKDISDTEYSEIDRYLTENGVKDNPALRYRLAMRENDFKKQQRLANERHNKIVEMEKGAGNVEKYQRFVEDLRTDPAGAFDKYKEEFDLPDSSFVAKAVQGGDMESKLTRFQDTELIPKLEKKYNIEEGTFVYDATEAYKAGTPSFEYRVATEKREKEFQAEYETAKNREKEILSAVTKERDIQMQRVKESFFKPSSTSDEDVRIADEQFTTLLGELDGMYQKMQQGDFSPAGNPFAFENIFKGVFFDKLVEKRIADVHSEYARKGMFLREKQVPTDVTRLNGNQLRTADEGKRGFKTPTDRFINRSIRS